MDNGVNPVLIAERQNGYDKFSAVDYIKSDIHRNVRLLALSHGYSFDGKPLFLAVYGELYRHSFTEDENGVKAIEMADKTPMYIFPSQALENNNRQGVIINASEKGYENNPLGLRIMVEVEFTDRIKTEKGRAEVEKLAKLNGDSVDGTPIIRTVEEIEFLTRNNLVTQKVKGMDSIIQTSFLITKVLDPANGVISPDSFLIMDINENRDPLSSESLFLEEFTCLQKTGDWCSAK